MSVARTLEDQLAAAVQEHKVPQAVVWAEKVDGSFSYNHAVGKTSMEDGAADVRTDAVFLFASQTKLLTGIAALQVVEKGLIQFDDDVAELVPELAGQPVLKGFDGEDKPILEERKVAITFRHLLTHTAGTAYDAADPNLIKFQTQRGLKTNSGVDVLSRYSYPLLFQPGEKWCYGSAMDWVGLVIERLTKQTLESYMKTNIWDPLNIKTMTFFPTPELHARVPVLSARGPDGKLYPYKEPFITTGLTGCCGGSGAYGSQVDYLTVQRSLLTNDGKLLRPESVDLLFKPQLPPGPKAALNETLASPMGAWFIGEFKADKFEHDWAFGGVVFVEGYGDGRRNAGTLSWGGVANTFWFMDREEGLVVIFGTQMVPPGDVLAKETIGKVEKAVHEMAGLGGKAAQASI